MKIRPVSFLLWFSALLAPRSLIGGKVEAGEAVDVQGSEGDLDAAAIWTIGPGEGGCALRRAV